MAGLAAIAVKWLWAYSDDLLMKTLKNNLKIGKDAANVGQNYCQSILWQSAEKVQSVKCFKKQEEQDFFFLR